MLFTYQKEIYLPGEIQRSPKVGLSLIRSPHPGIVRKFQIWGSATVGGQNKFVFTVDGGANHPSAGNELIITSSQSTDFDDTLEVEVDEGELISLNLITVSQSGVSNITWQLQIEDLDRQTQIVTGSLANDAEEVGVVSMAALSDLKRIVTSHKARIRLYKTEDARDADLSRTFGSYDWLDKHHMIICDFKLMNTAESPLDYIVNFVPRIQNGDDPTTNDIYYAIQNLHGSTQAITVDFYHKPREE